MQDDLLDAVETFYDCVDGGFDYERAVSAFSRTTDDTGICLTDIRIPGRFRLRAAVAIPDDAVQVMMTGKWDAESHGVFKHYARIPQGVPVLRRSIQSDEDYYRSRMYLEASAPWGLHSEGGCLMRKGLLGGTMYGFVRNPGQREVDHEILSRMAFLNGHLWRAIRLHKRIDRLEQVLIQSTNVIDLLEFGLVLHVGGGPPVFVNKAARSIFDARDGLELNRSGIGIRDRGAQRQFDDLFQALNDPAVPLAARAGGVVRVVRPSRKKPYSLMVFPFRAGDMFGLRDAGVVVLVFDPTAKQTTAIDLFVSSYGLTRAEASLAKDLAAGLSLDEFAEQRGISRNTAKAQLHAVFAKTETTRQGELVSLLLRSVAGVNLG